MKYNNLKLVQLKKIDKDKILILINYIFSKKKNWCNCTPIYHCSICSTKLYT